MSHYAKAITAALVAFAAGFTTAIQDASPGGESVVQNEWVLLAVSTVVAGLAVWAVPNKPEPPATA